MAKKEPKPLPPLRPVEDLIEELQRLAGLGCLLQGYNVTLRGENASMTIDWGDRRMRRNWPKSELGGDPKVTFVPPPEFAESYAERLRQRGMSHRERLMSYPRGADFVFDSSGKLLPYVSPESLTVADMHEVYAERNS